MILIRPQIFADKEYFILYVKIINLRVSVAKKGNSYTISVSLNPAKT